jgi:hypothetical protein
MTKSRVLHSLTLLGAGGFVAAIIFVACGDSMMQRLDAAIDSGLSSCNCPSAEPPIAVERVQQRFQTAAWDVRGGTARVDCTNPEPSGILLGGKCAFVSTSPGTGNGPGRFLDKRIRSSGYCNAGVEPTHQSSQEYCCTIDPLPTVTGIEDDSKGYVTAVAICLFPPGKVPPPSNPPGPIP